jgi:hypothetical protein
MATKDVLIDLTKPENYANGYGVRVKEFKWLGDNLKYPVEAIFKDGRSANYTVEGFINLAETPNSNWDLQLIKKRKIVHTSIAMAKNDDDELEEIISATTDDGSVFVISHISSWGDWEKLPDLPQD